MLIDSHAHLDMEPFRGDLDAVLARAREAGVGGILNVSFDRASIARTLALAEARGEVWAALGVHPHDASSYDDRLEEEIKRGLLRRKAVAVGEIGLDYYRDHSPRDVQREVFRRQIGLALYFRKPIVVHTREAFEDTVRILREEGAGSVGGVVHAFSGGEEEAGEVLDLGFHVGIGGPLTYRGSRLPAVAGRVPPGAILLETDCPYLPPVPHRGERNEPAHVKLVAEALAEILGVDAADVERATTVNFRRLFLGERDLPAAVAYGLKGGIYVNVTSACTNFCTFCSRMRRDNLLYGHNLNILADPSVDEMVAAAEGVAAGGGYGEIVFCGYGEPTARVRDIAAAAGRLKGLGLPIRLNTNGQGNLVNGRDIVPELSAVFDRVSISLNAPDADTYLQVCRPDAGERAFPAVVDFIRRAAASPMGTTVSAGGCPGVDLAACRRLVDSIPGARFRERRLRFFSCRDG